MPIFIEIYLGLWHKLASGMLRFQWLNEKKKQEEKRKKKLVNRKVNTRTYSMRFNWRLLTLRTDCIQLFGALNWCCWSNGGCCWRCCCCGCCLSLNSRSLFTKLSRAIHMMKCNYVCAVSGNANGQKTTTMMTTTTMIGYQILNEWISC